MTLELEVPFERNAAGGNVVEGFDNIDLGARGPVAQYVSPDGFIDTTVGVGIEIGIPPAPKSVYARSSAEQVIDAGPLSNYAADGVYETFRDVGFYVIRKGDKLVALSSNCTHRTCRLKAEKDHSFYCKCHGSTFDPSG